MTIFGLPMYCSGCEVSESTFLWFFNHSIEINLEPIYDPGDGHKYRIIKALVSINFKQRKFYHKVIIMSGEIVTKDLGDGYYLHTLNIETYYLTETIIGKTTIPDSFTAESPFLNIPQSLGQYEPYRLSQFVNSRDAIIEKGEIVKLADVENNKLKINSYALQIFKHYEDN